MTFAMPKLGRFSHTSNSSGVPRSTPEKMWLAGGVVGGLVLVLIAYLAFIGPQQHSTSDVRSQIDSARMQNTALQARITSLQAQNKNLAKYEASLAKAKLALPSTSGASDFLRNLQTLGNSTATTVSAFTLGAPTAVTPAAAAAPGAPGAPAASSTAPAAPAAPAAAAAAATAPQLYSMGITAQVTGTSANLNRFLQQLQDVQPRAVLITGVTTTTGGPGGAAPAGAAGGTSLALTMLAFVAPDAAAAPPSAAPSPTAGP